YRGASAFEKLRLATENSDKKPEVFLLTYGNPAMRKARATFSSGFFACAGFSITDNIGFDTVEAGIEAAKKQEADIVVVCSSDEEYANIVPVVYEQMKDQAIVVVAGAPACMDELKSKGIENFIHVKSNVLETLTAYQKALGI
ncbi:MAG TPA: methylmalonyl-CoA mutase small subunit, partial [Bacteroidales bacterium]|nr:methylmalonyl-CoA mutase small subunit [Bacteroidales bacterium]